MLAVLICHVCMYVIEWPMETECSDSSSEGYLKVLTCCTERQ